MKVCPGLVLPSGAEGPRRCVERPCALTSKECDVRAAKIYSAASLLLVWLFVSEARAQTFDLLVDFGDAEGMQPLTGLIDGGDGYWYGTTGGGGAGFGTIYRTDSTGQITTLHLFTVSDGSRPEAALVAGPDGNLYGTTRVGGANGKGVIFKFNPQTEKLTVLRSFNSSDGAEPRGAMVLGDDSNLYGTTSLGGLSGCGSTCGTIFRVTPSGTFTTLVKFNKTNGGLPLGALTKGSDGRTYGVTSKGGAADRGTVFAMTTGGSLTTLHSFNFTDGYMPSAGLIQASDGLFYGTTHLGGTNFKGTVFKISKSGNLVSLHSFAGAAGSNPRAELAEGSDGRFYGTTTMGGDYNAGTVFRMEPSGSVTNLRSLGNGDGSTSFSALLKSSSGEFYGTTSAYGPPGSAGTMFRITTAGGFKLMHAFKGSPAKPYSTLVEGADGLLRGTTYTGGGANKGTIYAIDPAGFGHVVHPFIGSDGSQPMGNLLESSSGAWYGTTSSGGSNLNGAVFKISTTGVVSLLASLSTSLGYNAYAGLLEMPAGILYGVTYSGGANKSGTIFQTVAQTGGTTAVHHFKASTGANPYGGLAKGPDGLLYGTTVGGGASGLGGLYSFDPLLGSYKLLVSFAGPNGSSPRSTLLYARDGSFYGTTLNGGANGFGTIFRFDPVTTKLQTLHSFKNSDGANPFAGLIQASDGLLYGTTYSGGASNLGAVFRFNPVTLGLSTLRSFNGSDGAYPHAGLVQARDGHLYGTTISGGSTGNGVVFRIKLGDESPTVTVTSPNGGEVLTAGKAATLKWTTTRSTSITAIDVKFSSDGGTTYAAVTECTNLSATSTSCVWNSPGPTTSTGRIRVIASITGGGSVSDASDANFSIVASSASVKVTSPNTAVNWGIGSTQLIKWKHDLGSGSSVKLELSRDGGSTWEVLAASVENNTETSGRYKWLVAGPATSQARVRVSGGGQSDMSDVNFKIAAPMIKVKSPNLTTDVWTSGLKATIKWKNNLGSLEDVTIELSKDGGVTYPVVIAAKTPSDGEHTVSVDPNWITTKARVRISWVKNSTVRDASDVNFVVK